MSSINDPTDQSAPRGLTGWQALTPARHRARLSMTELYFRYVGLGGSAPSSLLSRHFTSGIALAAGEHDLAVLALNERFMELSAPERLPYEGWARAR